ncbi:phosphodiester glycosidase family protein [Fictibacillus aquaticus]|uniref:SPOR domain-containing protein n=1 Tax=Fictibacillus aquaticus TaxID=2021314 RepID=A0A235F5Y8_9BACL|nr:phosphodiester glycosidase family protein [Fictibacillus aquaticus]OYD56513.1 hypothetical protein CGZ90_15995 [Fictibacillus aquaticus]
MNFTLNKSIIAVTAVMTLLGSAPIIPQSISSTASANENSASPFSKPMMLNSSELQPGLKHKEVVYGKPDDSAGYLINIDFSPKKADAEKLQNGLEQKGYKTVIITIRERPQDDNAAGALGYMVRTDTFETEQEAADQQKKLNEDGYADARAIHSSETGDPVSGPWKAHVLEIDPKVFNGKVTPSLATKVIPGKEKLTEMSARSQALAAVNGGYFVMGPADGTEGDLAGISMINGRLESEAVNGRSSFILNKNNKASIESLETKQSIRSANGSTKSVDGINRTPGLIRGCGGIDDTETTAPKHDFTCTDNSELIKFTSAYGDTTPTGEGAEAVIDSKGQVINVYNSRGNKIPPDAIVIAGTGDSAEWIKKNLVTGSKVKTKENVTKEKTPLEITRDTSIINGGPRLLDEGAVRIPAKAEGFHHDDNPEFFYQFGVRRHPRTMAGIKPDGTLLFVTIDGRKPGHSIGANFREAAEIMKSLGAVDAVNLDGGGSTTMTVNQKLINSPSDKTGERPIGDAILMLPAKK